MYNRAIQSPLGQGETVKASRREVTLLLQEWRRGDQAALDKLVPLVYQELHRLAHMYMAHERLDHTLRTTALVNEAYVRLIELKQVQWQDRVHFFAISATMMRRVLVEFARSRRSRKRGGEVQRLEFDEAAIPPVKPDADLIALDDALNALAAIDPRGARVVELRFFGGLTVDETAEVLGISDKTVMRDWELARVWLLHELKHRG
jgi:RNA polymerase sigma factor (TIGR02999 family)